MGNATRYIDSHRLSTLIAALEELLEEANERPLIIPELHVVIDRIMRECTLSEETQGQLLSLKEINDKSTGNGDRHVVWKEINKLPERIRDAIDKVHKQKWLNLLPVEDPKIAEIIRSIGSKTGALILTAHPREFKIIDERFIVYVKRRLMLDIIPSNFKCSRCQQPVDPLLEHTFACKHIGKNSVHSQVNQTLMQEVRRLHKEANTGTTIYYEPKIDSQLHAGYNKYKERCDFAQRNHITPFWM